MARLSAVPESPPRAIGYIRVSTARDDMVSPEIQQAAIDNYCARNGYRLAETITDLDLSGRFWKRRQVERAIAMIEAGDADVIVVWKGSRLARNRLDWAVAVDRIETVGGRLESATEPVDTSTSTGRFTRGMLAELAAFESDRIGEGWKEAHARRTQMGLPANGKPRFGYVHVDGLHRPDPETGPALADLYRRYVAGESFYSLAVWLNGEGIRTVAGYSTKGPGDWVITSVRAMLDTGFGAGFITVHGSREPGVHEPVIDSDTWAAYRAARVARRRLKRAESSEYLLSAMVWCGCGSKMGGGYSGTGDKKVPRFRCLLSTAPSQPRHRGAYLPMAPVDAAVFDWLTVEAGKAVGMSADEALVRRSRDARRRGDADALALRVIEADRAIGRLTADLARGLVPESAYGSALEELTTERGQLEDRRLAAQVEAASPEPALFAAQLVKHWDVYDVAHRRAALRRLIERVTLTWLAPGDVRVVVTPVWAFEITP